MGCHMGVGEVPDAAAGSGGRGEIGKTGTDTR